MVYMIDIFGCWPGNGDKKTHLHINRHQLYIYPQAKNE